VGRGVLGSVAICMEVGRERLGTREDRFGGAVGDSH
jgi:hypothetical protein